MKLASQSRIFILLLGIIIIGALVLYYQSTSQVKFEIKTTQNVRQLIQGVFELSLLTNAYISNPTKRISVQWNNRHASLTNLLLELEIRSDKNTTRSVKGTRVNLARLRVIFFKILAVGRVNAGGVSVTSKRLIDRLGSQVRILTQKIVSDVNVLGEKSQVALLQTQDNVSLLIQSVLILIACIVVTMMIWVRRSFLTPILKLQQHSIRLIGGNYHSKLILSGKNEITDLSNSVNTLSDTIAVKLEALLKNETSLELLLSAAKSAELRYSTIFMSTVDSIFTINDVGIIQSVNPAGEKLFGYSADELVGQNVSLIVAAPHKLKHDSYLKNYKNTGEAKIIGIGRDVEGIRKDGSLVPVALTIQKMEIEGKTFYSGVLRDISKEIEAKEAILEANRQLNITNEKLNTNNWLGVQIANITELTQGANDLALMCNNIVSTLSSIVDAGHGVLYVIDNSTAKSKTVEQDMLLSRQGSYALTNTKNISDKIAIGEGLVGQCAKEKKVIYLTNVPGDYIKINSALGEKTPLSLLIVPILFENQLKGVIELAAFREFTVIERKLIDIVTENIGIAINGIQREKRTERLLEETQRQSEELQAQQEELQASNENLEEQTQHLKASEEELKTQSEELRASNEELSEKSSILEVQKEDMERSREDLEIKTRDLSLASKYKSEFLANMSHELRTPLNSFLLLSKGLSDNETDNLNEDQLEDLRIIYEGGLDLLRIINDIMDLSKVEAGKLSVHAAVVDLDETCRSLTNLFSQTADIKGLKYSVSRSESSPSSIWTDSQRLEQILKNFLSNAFKFTSAGSIQIKIHLAEAKTRFLYSSLSVDSAVAFSVIDTGIGIPADKQHEIFEAFQQQDGSTSRKYGGTGLGLTISRELAKLLGGEVQLTSIPGKGSTFTLYLPLTLEVEPEAGEIKTSPERQPNVEIPSSNIPQEHVSHKSSDNFFLDDRYEMQSGDNVILIIEDDVNFAKVLLGIVRNHGYRGLVARDGRSGLYLALEYQPKGIFLDYGLPDMDGSQVLEQLKFHIKTKHIPVHVITGLEQGIETLQHGAFGLLTKPANKEDISRVIAQMENITSSSIKTALIVEDNKGSQRAIAGLISNKGIMTESVDTGVAAVQKITTGNYDLIILDIGLPDISGFKVLDQLSQKNDVRLPPVIVYTGQELNVQQRNILQKYSATIILKDAESPEKLLDEALLFMHSMVKDLSSSQKKTIYNIHDEARLLKDRKILLVDDDMRNTFALSKRLQAVGLKVIEADNGQNALDKLNKCDDIELVLMDIMMPVMDGYEAMRQIRQSSQYSKVPIIALTAKAMLEDRDKCIASGASDYLTKPVDFDQLLSMLKVWLFRK